MGTRKIKVIHLVNDLGIGGTQRVVLDICSSADLEKYDVSVYSLSDCKDLLKTYDLDHSIGIKTFASDADFDFSYWAYLKRALWPSSSLPKMRRIVDEVIEICPDILHVHLVSRDLNLGILIREKTGCELLYTQHLANFPTESLGTRLLGNILGLTFRQYHLIAVGRSVKDEILRHDLVGREKKLFLIENKLNEAQYTPAVKRDSGNIVVVYVARIAPVKGHYDLITAWSLLKNLRTPKKLVLVGPDAMNGEMQELARNLDVADTIDFMGAQDRVKEILNDSDIAVFPSHQEGLPIALLEKMAMKLPVLVSDIPELTAIVKDGENGLVFRCGDSSDLAEKLSRLISDPELRERLGQNARETIEKDHGSTNIAAPNEAVYDEILRARS